MENAIKWFVDFDETNFSTWVEVETDFIETYILKTLRELYADGVYEKPAPGDKHTVAYAQNIGIRPGFTTDFMHQCHTVTFGASELMDLDRDDA